MKSWSPKGRQLLRLASHAFDELTAKHGHADGGAQGPKAHENRSCNVDVLHDCSRVLSRNL